MKNLRLTPVLIPTEDESILYLDNEYGKLHCLDYATNNQYLYTNQHLYLCSTPPIREGDWVLDIIHLKIGKAELAAGNYKNTSWRKIILTTDLKLIADGVPAIDGNAKANAINICYKNGIPKNWFEVNFLSEFVKRWNGKDNQKDGYDDWMKMAENNKKIVEYESFKSAEEYLNFHSLEKDGGTIEITFEGLVRHLKMFAYDQAIQSNAGGFSLEDIRKAFFDGGIDLSSNKEDEVQFKEFIQSLTKEQPKGDEYCKCYCPNTDSRDTFSRCNTCHKPVSVFQPKGGIVIECEMEPNTYGNKYRLQTSGSKIKLKDGQLILIFK